MYVYHVLFPEASPQFERINVRLPEKIGDTLVGHHFRVTYNANINRWTAQDYDGLAEVTSIAAEDAVQRYCVKQYLLAKRVARVLEY